MNKQGIVFPFDENTFLRRMLRIIRRNFTAAITGLRTVIDKKKRIEPILVTNRSRLCQLALKFEAKIEKGMYILSHSIVKEIRFEIVRQLAALFPKQFLLTS